MNQYNLIVRDIVVVYRENETRRATTVARFVLWMDG